ncbi:hypothetical protein MIND_00154700 [Mycena indigotica]|uniref:Uncharacterized protein n=1 Tax=Mycena indigotica TaxID=2126181 RepID=A0A8H6WL22_9AGAR|nr:uncharacterized protein MIND_00154700 [Mycena indigotica]KAF7316359.1 hypothetical protein MIND_00154700 [Mycena indigotica]
MFALSTPDYKVAVTGNESLNIDINMHKALPTKLRLVLGARVLYLDIPDPLTVGFKFNVHPQAGSARPTSAAAQPHSANEIMMGQQLVSATRRSSVSSGTVVPEAAATREREQLQPEVDSTTGLSQSLGELNMQAASEGEIVSLH